MSLTVASLGFGSRTGTAGIVTMGFGTLGSSPTPTPIPATDGGGPSMPARPSETVRDYREWLRIQEFEREQSALKKKITVAVRKKKRATVQLQFANGSADLQTRLNALAAAQADLQALTTAYVEFMTRIRQQAQASYEDEMNEFLEFVMEEL